MAFPSSLEVAPEDLHDARAIAASEMVLGNGNWKILRMWFTSSRSASNCSIPARSLKNWNRSTGFCWRRKRPYMLIVFGRLGTLDPWLGIPVTWGQISGARVIVEAAQENVRVEPSQGSHYFHNIINLGSSTSLCHFQCPYPDRLGLAEQSQECCMKVTLFATFGLFNLDR
jgi:hypothetical protein